MHEDAGMLDILKMCMKMLVCYRHIEDVHEDAGMLHIYCNGAWLFSVILYGYTTFCVQSAHKLYIFVCVNIELGSGTNCVDTNHVPTSLRFSQVNTQ